MPDDDNALLTQAIAGDADALATLLERQGPVIRGQLIPQMPTRWQSLLSVEDVLQQTFADAFVDIKSLRTPDVRALHAWLLRLAKRNLIDAIRMLEAAKRGGDRKRVEATTREESFVALHEMLGAVTNTPSRDARRGEAISAMDVALAKLPEPHQTVIKQYDLESRSIEEVAKAIGRTPGATYMLRARAHRMLAEALGSPSKFFGDSM